MNPPETFAAKTFTNGVIRRLTCQRWIGALDRHNFPEVVASAGTGGHKLPEVVPIMASPGADRGA
jgi:hypothetical protein